MQLSKNTRYHLFRLTGEVNSLNEVKNKILPTIHKEPLKLIGLSDSMEDEEKYYYSHWDEGSSEESSIVLHLGSPLEHSQDENENKIYYLRIPAICEYATRRRKDENGEVLPKNRRLNIDQTDILFIDFNQEIYVVAFTTEYQPLRRIKKLIGDTYIACDSELTKLTSDLFHWLFYRYSTNKSFLGEYIELENISGFTGIVMTDDHTFTGLSDQTADLIVTKAFISNGYPIKSIKVQLYSGNGRITFFVDEDDNLSVERGSNIDLLIPKNKEDIAMPIFLFFIVLPELRNLYESDKSNFICEEKYKFNAEIGKDVIRSIASRNNIDLSTL